MVMPSMANPISASTKAFLESLDETVHEAAEAVVSRKSLEPEGIDLDLEDEINLAKAIKFVASADGFSRDELNALKFLMIMASLPNELQQHVIDFDVDDLTLEQVGGLFQGSARKAGYVLSGATTVAAFDGLSAEELAQSRELANKLELDTTIAEAIIANAWTLGLAMKRGDQAVVKGPEGVRQGILAWL